MSGAGPKRTDIRGFQGVGECGVPQTPQVSQGVTELGRNFSDVETYAAFEGRLHWAGNKFDANHD